MDYETDRLIQLTIRSEFRGSTVITVAHRLNTVMDADRMLVLADGEVAEYDSPRALLRDEGGVLARMVANTGNSAAHLHAIANGEATAFAEEGGGDVDYSREDVEYFKEQCRSLQRCARSALGWLSVAELPCARREVAQRAAPRSPMGHAR